MLEPSVDSPEQERPGRGRILRFVSGYALGAVGVPVLLGLAGFTYIVVHERLAKPATTRSVFVVSGEELTKSGATSVVWRRSREALRQTCRGACDDLAYRYEAPRAAQVDGAKGKASDSWVRQHKERVR